MNIIDKIYPITFDTTSEEYGTDCRWGHICPWARDWFTISWIHKYVKKKLMKICIMNLSNWINRRITASNFFILMIFVRLFEKSIRFLKFASKPIYMYKSWQKIIVWEKSQIVGEFYTPSAAAECCLNRNLFICVNNHASYAERFKVAQTRVILCSF